MESWIGDAINEIIITPIVRAFFIGWIGAEAALIASTYLGPVGFAIVFSVSIAAKILMLGGSWDNSDNLKGAFVGALFSWAYGTISTMKSLVDLIHQHHRPRRISQYRHDVLQDLLQVYIYSSEHDLPDSNNTENSPTGGMGMLKARPTRRRVLVGVALVVIGLVVLSLVPLSLDEVLLLSSTAFASITMMLLGLALIGGMPIKKILLGLFVGGLWVFLFAVPISLLPLSPEIPPIVLGFSALALTLIIGLYERRKARVNGNGERAESSASQ